MKLRDGPDAFANAGRKYTGAATDPPPPGKSNGKGKHQHQTDWHLLLRTRRGVVIPSTANIAIELEHDPAWEGVIAYDEFEQQLMLSKQLPWFSGQHRSRHKAGWPWAPDRQYHWG
jgi:hypothetical protein